MTPCKLVILLPCQLIMVKRWLTPCKLVTLLLVTLSTNNGEKMAAPINLLTRFLVNLSPYSLAPLFSI